ncbi:MAG: DeoR/GlpR family DNA-binding transcription regulator, partial [Gammaproteobacteria bacterium]|nr:DeoR/GlpR family DNA-binding transcription regulator [Gammaproteobacteria bacterium]
ARFDISRETIRRDLTKLANSGKIQKVHGGAILPRVFGEGSFGQRMSENSEAKMRIASKAVELFGAGETLFIDTGSTTLYFAEKLIEVSGLTIITNSTEIAKTISSSDQGNRIFLLGGEYNADNRQTAGTLVASQIRLFRVHHTVLTVGALDVRTGAMDFNIEEAQVAHAMIEQSETLTVLVDSSKFNKLASFEVCPLSRIDQLVCDIMPPDELRKALEAAGVEIFVAP